MTPADELRELLDLAERRLGQIERVKKEEVIELLGWLDQIASLVDHLEADGVDLRSERTRLESLEGSVHRQAGAIVRRAGQAIAEKRQEIEPSEDRWWWWLDRMVMEAARQRVVRGALTVGIVAAVALMAYSLFNIFLPTDPEVEKAQGYQLTAERFVMDGNWASAEAQFTEALKHTPKDVMLWTWLGITREEQDNQQGADEAFAHARDVAGTELTYRLARGQAYTQANLPAKALAEAEKAVALEPDSAQAHFILAGAYESSGRALDAINEFEKVSGMAENTDPQLVVLSRMRMGMLMQSGAAMAPVTTTMTTTVTAP
jgi:cytochrome c-type biogenesis protein CcmH/NrfG